ncbi:Hypothetical predicted protein [Mytilus galloprovincialis]|uniref:Uncharacterized protein n=1 Tax=Mytilus galloprovincialis TaxID=29158 RepID=A0A8B6F3V4_MYTGA|nr:Hypothetical predicted protein [Mytilus galloprovincialis]
MPTDQHNTSFEQQYILPVAMSSKSRKATKKVPGFVALHLTDNDSSAISPVFRLLGNAAYYINNNNSSPKAKVILCGKVRDALIIKFSGYTHSKTDLFMS